MPFPNKLLAENLRSRDGERVAATIYGVTLLGAMLLIFPIRLPRREKSQPAVAERTHPAGVMLACRGLRES